MQLIYVLMELPTTRDLYGVTNRQLSYEHATYFASLYLVSRFPLMLHIGFFYLGEMHTLRFSSHQPLVLLSSSHRRE